GGDRIGLQRDLAVLCQAEEAIDGGDDGSHVRRLPERGCAAAEVDRLHRPSRVLARTELELSLDGARVLRLRNLAHHHRGEVAVGAFRKAVGEVDVDPEPRGRKGAGGGRDRHHLSRARAAQRSTSADRKRFSSRNSSSSACSLPIVARAWASAGGSERSRSSSTMRSRSTRITAASPPPATSVSFCTKCASISAICIPCRSAWRARLSSRKAMRIFAWLAPAESAERMSDPRRGGGEAGGAVSASPGRGSSLPERELASAR